MSEDIRQDEARNPSTATFKWRGEEFTVSRERDEWTVDFLESLEEGKSVGIIRGALGPQQWRTVRAMNLKVRDLDDLSVAVANALGFGSTGESSASSS
jgi:uncharacterized phage-like protein YoqJ